MRFDILTACALAALTVAACGDGDGVRITSTTTSSDGEGKGVLKVIDALQCPESMGPLTRKGTARQGGTVCIYTGPRGAEVSLHMVRLDGDTPDDVLKAFEERLARDLPQATEALDRGAATPEAEAVAVDAEGDRAEIRAPGVHIRAEGDKADLRLGPIHISADDSGGEGEGSATINAEADGESVSIQAHGRGAEVRTRSNGDAVRASWRLSDSRGSESGWRVVGYQARGPARGPLVIATIRTRDRDGDRMFDAAGDLVKLNVGD